MIRNTNCPVDVPIHRAVCVNYTTDTPKAYSFPSGEGIITLFKNGVKKIIGAESCSTFCTICLIGGGLFSFRLPPGQGGKQKGMFVHYLSP